MCENKPVIYSEIEEKITFPENECEITYQVNKQQSMTQTWDCQKDEFIQTPEDLKNFFGEIDLICQKYNFSISHEDLEGGFEIMRYDKGLMKKLRAAAKNYNEP